MGEEKPINVLYLSYDGMTDPLGESQVIPYLKGLNKSYAFWLISYEKHEKYKKDGHRIKKYLDQLGIYWYPQIYHKQPPVLSTLYDLVVMNRVARQLVQQHKIKLVHCRSYPSGLIGLRLKRKMGLKFLFDIRGFWANERVDGGIWDLKSPLFRGIYTYFKKKEAEMMSEADHIISLTYAGKAEIVSGRLFEYPHEAIPEEKVTVIPCAVDLELFDPKKITESQKKDLKSKIGLRDTDKIMCYLGSVGTWYMLEEMLLFFKHWIQTNPEYKFVFVTHDDASYILNIAEQNGLTKSSILIYKASRLEVPLYLSISDLGIFFIKPAYSKKASSATKMGEMLAMGLDMICNIGVGDVEVFKETKIDTLMYSSDLRPILLQAAQNQQKLESFSLESSLKRYEEVYTGMR